MRHESVEYDIYVTVDNFVEIGDFFAIFDSFYKKYGGKAVEKSINGFQFIPKSTQLVNIWIAGEV